MDSIANAPSLCACGLHLVADRKALVDREGTAHTHGVCSSGRETTKPEGVKALPPVGVKKDSGKPRWGLVPWAALTEIVKVLTFGAVKYAPSNGGVEDNWKKVPGAKKRYLEAAQRHLVASFEGEVLDPESGLYHLAHAGCCTLFLLYFQLTGTGD